MFVLLGHQKYMCDICYGNFIDLGFFFSLFLTNGEVHWGRDLDITGFMVD